MEFEALEFLKSLGRSERERMHLLFRKLRDFPYNHSKYTELNGERQIRVCIHRKFAVKYWIDEADEHIKIFEINPTAERD